MLIARHISHHLGIAHVAVPFIYNCKDVLLSKTLAILTSSSSRKDPNIRSSYCIKCACHVNTCYKHISFNYFHLYSLKHHIILEVLCPSLYACCDLDLPAVTNKIQKTGLSKYI